MRKLYAVFVPLLAVVAFASVTAAASAAPQWQVCKAKTGGKFTTIACSTEGTPKSFEKETIGSLLKNEQVQTTSKNIGAVTLAGEAGGISCTTVADKGFIWNSRGRGRDIDEIEFSGCTGTGGLATCTVTNPIIAEAATKLEESGGVVTNKYSAVSGEPFAEVTLANKGTEVCPAPGTFPVTGTAVGTFTGTSGKVQKFSGKTLTFLGKEAEFKGETEEEGTSGGAGIFVT
jgi:hypothetical protein